MDKTWINEFFYEKFICIFMPKLIARYGLATYVKMIVEELNTSSYGVVLVYWMGHGREFSKDKRG